MSRETEQYLDDMRQACRKVLRYTEGMDLQALLDDQRTYDAVVRNLEILGEAAKRVADAERARYPDIEWRSGRHRGGRRPTSRHSSTWPAGRYSSP